MLTTSTHDTKRSEDVRARLAVLSEMPDEWITAVERWRTTNDRHRDAAADAPDARDEWFIYQTLAGAHPCPFDRAWPVVEKSLREAKRRTSWVRVNDDYEAATRRFLESILADDAFMADFSSVVSRLIEPGRVNSLAQATLRLLCPGVPDTYQGTELWDSSLVDPDNRRPVDFAAREDALRAVESSAAADLWISRREEGLPKLALLRACLAVRRRHPDAFGPSGTYTPLDVSGRDGDRVLAFARGEAVVAAVPRRPLAGLADDAVVVLPGGDWTSVLTGEIHAGQVAFGKLRGGFPVAVLQRDLEPVG